MVKSLPLVLLAALSASYPACAATFQSYDTGDFGEQLTEIPGDFTDRVLFSKDVGPIAAGDILVVYAEADASNTNPSTAQWTAVLRMGTDKDDVGTLSLTPGNNMGLTAGIHHGVQVKGAIHVFASGSSATFVNLVVKSTQTLTVEQDYGRLQVLKISP